ncbi:MAG: ABC transporter substrate-binding protein [Deltaproteobacteria bacterium]|nr:ABC transporter substrate-binding protein [Deltaproteobacteria bacterium]MBI3060513.1 ABC transporter substrate-binding protein [Deltaproteobacteria bacterium]
MSMIQTPTATRLLLILWACIFFLAGLSPGSLAQTQAKKIRMGIPSTNVSFLPMFVAHHKGFYREEGIDLELILVAANLASTAVLTGDIDYNAAVTGVIGAAVRGRPMKVLIFTVDRPLLFLISKKEIKEPRQLRGKKVAGSSPGGSATLLAHQALRHFGLEPGRDVSVLPAGGAAAARFAALESGVVDASLLSVPENIIAMEKGYNELIFLGDVVQFPQNGFGASEKKIRESPDEILKMIRATLRGLQFIWDKNNHEAVLDILMKQWRVNDRKMAGEMLRHLMRVLTRDAYVKPESVQVLIDLQRENAKVTKLVTVSEVFDYSFLDKARKELGLAR